MIHRLYRAWIKAEKRMARVSEIRFMEDELHSISDEKYNHYLADEIVLIESTGVKDKHGVNIFDGDIITYEIGGIVYSHIVQYIGKTGCYGFDTLATWSPSQIEFEIIGNIYENLDWRSLVNKYGGIK